MCLSPVTCSVHACKLRFLPADQVLTGRVRAQIVGPVLACREGHERPKRVQGGLGNCVEGRDALSIREYRVCTTQKQTIHNTKALHIAVVDVDGQWLNAGLSNDTRMLLQMEKLNTCAESALVRI